MSRAFGGRAGRFLWPALAVSLAIVGLFEACSKKSVTAVSVATVSVTPATATLIVGEVRSFTAEVRDRSGTRLPSSVVTWSSTNESVVSVSTQGAATALQPGTAQVQATARGVTGTANVTVQTGPIIAVDTGNVTVVAQLQGANPDPVEIQIGNAGHGELTGLSATVQYGDGEPSGWLNASFSSTTAPATLTLTATTGSLSLGTYHATVTVGSPAAQAAVDINVELTVSQDRPIIKLTPSAVGFAGDAGGPPPATQAIQVTNVGGGMLTGLSSSVAYPGVGGWLTASLSSDSAPAVLSLTADPASLAAGSYTATVKVASPVAANSPSTLKVTFAVDIEPVADLTVSKIGPRQVILDDTAAFVITVGNAGPRDAVSVTLTDTLPPELGYVRSSGGGSQFRNVVTWSLGIVPPGTTVVDTVWTVASQLGSTQNEASATSVTKDTVTSNNVAIRPVTIVPKPADLSVTKTGPDTATAGTDIVYDVTAYNLAGPGSASGVVVTDTLPSSLTFVSSTGGISGGAYDAASRAVTWNVDTLMVGDSAKLTLTVAIDPPAGGSVSNRAWVGSSTADSVTSNNVSTATTTVLQFADLSVAKAGPGTATAGSDVTYTIAVRHQGGTSDASGVVVTDTLPSSLTFVSATGGISGGAYDAASRAVTWSVDTLAVGDSTMLGLTATVGSGVSGSIDNRAWVGTASMDTVATNDSSTAVTTVTQSADLSVTKTGPSMAAPGSNVTYTIVVKDSVGPSDASSVVVTDTLPSSLTFVSSTGGTSGGSYDATSRAVTWNLSTLAAGGSATVTVTATIDPAATAPVSNTATVTSATTDPAAANNSSTATTTVSEPADLSVTKTAPATATAGTDIVYDVTAYNLAGPGSASGVVVTDTLPSSLTFVSSTGGTGGGSYDAASRAVTWSVSTLAVGDSAKLALTATVPASASGSLTNRAWVASTTTPDTVATNDSSTAVTTVSQSADVSVAKSAPASVAAGSSITYTIAVKDSAGPSDASTVVVTDTLPAGLTFSSATGGGTNSGGVVTWSVGTLAAGGSTSLGLTATVPASASGSLTNRAWVSTSTADTVAANDSSTAVTTVTQSADLSVTKTGPDSAAAGTDVTYTIVVKDSVGPSDASGVVVTDTLPSWLTFVSSTGGTGGGSYNATSRAVTWDLSTLAAGGSATVTVTVTIDPAATATVSNTATVTSATTDPAAANNSSTATTTIG